MKRPLSGSLEHLDPLALLRLVSATSPNGILEIETDRGKLVLEVERGRVSVPGHDELRHVRSVLASRRGAFRFQPADVGLTDGEACSLSELAAIVEGSGRWQDDADAAGLEAFRMEVPSGPTDIHVLPESVAEDPLGDLLGDLESEPPGELLFARLAVIAQDPRPWRGTLERQWLGRGWRLELLPLDAEFDPAGFDAVIIHHREASVRTGRELEWLSLIREASAGEPPVPVIWVAPLGDPEWVHRLIEAGVSFLMPAPVGEAGEAFSRFAEGLTQVVDRQLQRPRGLRDTGISASVSELVGALLSASDPDEGVRSLLTLAAETFSRGALLAVSATTIRSRAGFGYPMNSARTALPRGFGLLERVIRTGEAVLEIDPSSGGARLLAEVCGVTELPTETAVIPLGRFNAVAGVLVADREGEALPDLDELVVLAGRLGGAVIT